MKKTFSINIAGQIFHIDDDAYELLQQYLTSLKHHFENKEGGAEIIEDIESRISELLAERVSASKQVVVYLDVKEIIDQLGQPFEIDDENNQQTEEAKNEEHKNSYTKKQKRLYRDSDHKVIGGVCSGLGAYFNIDPVIIRIGFALAFLIAGSSFWVYLILWIAIPEARTTAEKLEMTGDPVNVDNIEKKIKTEFEDLKKRFGTYKDEAKDVVNNIKRNTPPKSTFDNLMSTIVEVLKHIGRAFSILFGVFFVFIGAVIAIALAVSMFPSSDSIYISFNGIQTLSIPQLLELVLNSSESLTLAIFGLATFIGLPMLMLIYSGVKLIFNLKVQVKFLGLSVFLTWLFSAILLTIIGANVLIDMSKSDTISNSFELNQPINKTLYLQLSADTIPQPIVLDEECENFPIFMSEKIDQKRFYGAPELVFKQSVDSNYKVVVNRSARGKNLFIGHNRANAIQYTVRQNGDSLVLNPLYLWSIGEVWRGHSVQVVIYCPKDKNIHIGSSLAKLICLNGANDYLEPYISTKVDVDSDEFIVKSVYCDSSVQSKDSIIKY